MSKPQFIWDETIGTAICILADGDKEYVGTAFCAEDDKDMMSEKTGCTIAMLRAEISYYKDLRDTQIKPGLRALNQLYYSMNTSKNYDEKSYYAKMLRRQIRQHEFDLLVVNQTIDDRKQELKTFLADKAKAYETIRRIRKNKQKADNN